MQEIYTPMEIIKEIISVRKYVATEPIISNF